MSTTFNVFTRTNTPFFFSLLQHLASQAFGICINQWHQTLAYLLFWRKDVPNMTTIRTQNANSNVYLPQRSGCFNQRPGHSSNRRWNNHLNLSAPSVQSTKFRSPPVAPRLRLKSRSPVTPDKAQCLICFWPQHAFQNFGSLKWRITVARLWQECNKLPRREQIA